MIPAIRPRRRAAAGAAVVSLLFVSACEGDSGGSSVVGEQGAAGSPSPEAYCEAFYSRAAPLRDEYLSLNKQSEANPLVGLLPALGAPGRLAVVFDGMVPHAPDDIRPETEAVRDTLQDVQDNLGEGLSDPARAALKNLLLAAASSPSFEAVDGYLARHCPVGSPIAARYGATTAPPSPSVSPSAPPLESREPVNTAPPVGTQLTSLSGSGGYSVATNGTGFAIVRSLVDISTDVDIDKSTVTTYDAAGNQLATIPAGSLTGDCAATDVVTADGQRIILTQKITETPAQGIQPATYSVTLDAWDAVTGEDLWSTIVLPPQEDLWTCDIYSGAAGVLDRFAHTLDSRWGVYQGGPTSDESNIVLSQVIDLSSGQVIYAGDIQMRVLGNYLVGDGDGGYNQEPVTVFDPATAQPVGELTGFPLAEAPSAATTGMFDQYSDGGGVGLSDDGSRLFAPLDAREPTSTGTEQMTQWQMAGYSLPHGEEAWTTPQGFQMAVVAAGGDTLIVANHRSGELIGLRESTGDERWALPAARVCGVTDSQFMVSVNEQLAVINMATGEQVSYTDGESCPDLRAGGIEVRTGSIAPGEPHGVTVVQALTP